MSDRVLVPMSRSEAEWYDALGEGTGHGPTHSPLRAALDTDREKQIERIVLAQLRAYREYHGNPTGIPQWERLSESGREMWLMQARAVLTALEEGEDDE